MTLSQIIDLFEHTRGGVEVPDHTARDIAASLRTFEQELAAKTREVAMQRYLIEPVKRATR